MSSDNINNPAFAVDNDLNDDISSGLNTTAESETDNSTIDGAVASDDSTFGAKRQSLAVLQQLGLELGHSIVYDKAAATRGTFRNGDAEVKLTTNIYGLKTKAINVYTYHIDMEKWFETGRHFPVVDLGRRTSDYTTLQNRQLQQKLLTAFMVKYPNVFGQDYEIFCFDYANTLYSLIELDNFDISMSMDPEETYAAINRGYKTTLNVKKPKENVFNIRDLTKSKSLNLAEQPYHIIRFLELATSRYISLHPEEHIMYDSKQSYFMEPGNYGFDMVDLGGGKYLSAGAFKSVACVEGPKSKGAPAVIVDSKKTPFYKSINLYEMLSSAINVKHNIVPTLDQCYFLNNYVKRLEVFPLHGNRQNAPICLSGLTEGDALTTVFEYNGVETSVAEYFSQRYKIHLRYPHWPLAICSKKVNGNIQYFPVELLEVADCQRVSNSNISPVDNAAIVKACAVAPSIKKGEIASCLGSFSFGIDAFMIKAGMEVLQTPLEVKARVLKAPQVRYSKNTSGSPEQNGKWRLPKPATYVKCASLKRWIAFFLIVDKERMKLNQFREFAERFYNECWNRGIETAAPLRVVEVPCNATNIEEAFVSAKREQCEYIIFGHSDNDTKHHEIIKGFEQKYEVITQCVKTSTILKVMTKSPLSLENIVAKTNVKLGGLNYDIVLHDFPIESSVLFVGLGMNHPSGGMGNPQKDSKKDSKNASKNYSKDASENEKSAAAGSGSSSSSDTSTFPTNVSILGFSANDGVSPNEFTGNFFFSPMYRDEKLSVLDKLLEEILERFQKNRGYPPSRIILFRNGCDEGSYQSVLRFEMPVISTICDKYAPGAPVTVIVPSKVHSFRFFNQEIDPKERSDFQNIRPGTVLDEHVVSNAYSEFFLNSHLAIQGTAKTPRYTILFSSEKDVNLDVFERWTNALCYNFQIVTSPTSLPAPLYVAQRYAERGRQIWNVNLTSGKMNRGENDDDGLVGGADGIADGANGIAGNVSPPHDSDESDSTNSSEKPNLAPVNQFFMASLSYNFSKKDYLRGKRVNA